MATHLVTVEDLEIFKADILGEIQKLLNLKETPEEKAEHPTKWLKSHQVQRLLGISPGTLQNLRINGTIPYTKMGGVIFYSLEDINTIMQRNKRNPISNGKKGI
jgi:hypothetical protein